MKLNRKWIMVLALVMSMAMATTGTLAYLTDRDSEANVFTMGNVEIDLNEEFDPEGAELIPGVNIEKKPTITNTGKNDAWVWATIAIPSKLDSSDASKNIVHFNFTKESTADGLWQWTDKNGEYMVEIGKKIDDTDILYNVYTVLYETPLKPGETTEEPVISKVYMDYHIDIDTKGDVYHVENGVVDGPYWNVETDGKPVIYVSAYAIQTEGFETVQEGYAAYNAQWGDKGAEYGEADKEIDTRTFVTTSEELVAALAAGGKVTLANDIEVTARIDIPSGVETILDMAGKTITDNHDSMTIWVHENAKLTITGNGEIIKNNHDENMFYFDGELNVMNGAFSYTDYTWGECTDCEHGTNARKVGCMFVGRGVKKGYNGKLQIFGGTFNPGVLNPETFVYGDNISAIMFPLLNNNASSPSEMTVYGGTYVSANPADGDANEPWTLYLEGQTEKGVVPAGYSITEGKLTDGRTTYTVTYTK